MNRSFKVIAIIIFCCGFVSASAYAADDSNNLGQLLDKIRTYDFGQSRERLNNISDMIHRAGDKEKKEIEKQLDTFLKSDANYAAKQFVCEQLSTIGAEASVPVLAKMLTDEKTADMARYALERIPGDAADKALREAIPKVSGNAKVGIINTLGVRGSKKAVDTLAKLTSDANQTVAEAAISALGKIDDPRATGALSKMKDKTTGAIRAAVLDAYLHSADLLAAKGQNAAASAIYKQLYAPAEPQQVRTAAVRGMILTAGDKAADTIADVLKSDDRPMQSAAIGVLKDVTNTDAVKTAAQQLPNLAPAQQVQLLAALADCNARAALPAVLAAAKNADEQVRIAALSSLGILGDAETVQVLVQTAAATRGNEQKAAQESLYRLQGTDIDKVILRGMPEADPRMKVELIRACDHRNITASVPELMKDARGSDSQVRAESIKALRAVAGPQDMAGLIELQIAASGADRTELEKTVAAVARQIPMDKNPAQSVLAALPSAKDVDTRCSLLGVLGKIGDPAALPVLREAVGDANDNINQAAVRALSDWPTPAPADELLKIAKTPANETQKTLALRGYVRLAGLESNRPAEETVKMYKEAMALAANTAEKQMVLSGLANVRHPEALQWAGSFLDDAELKQEAEAAAVKIAESIIRKYPEQAREMLKKVQAGTTSESTRQQTQRLLKQGG